MAWEMFMGRLQQASTSQMGGTEGKKMANSLEREGLLSVEYGEMCTSTGGGGSKTTNGVV